MKLYLLLFFFLFNNAHAIPITYGITVSTESEELNRLLNQLKSNLEDEDMIIVQIDDSNTNKSVQKVINKFKEQIQSPKFVVLRFALNKDFATFKNNLLNNARKYKRNYFFQLDADEYLSDPLIKNFKWFISKNPHIDLIKVPRANYYVNSEEDPPIREIMEKEFDALGRFRYQDSQSRIFNLANPEIKFIDKIHEKIVGFKKSAELPYKSQGISWDIIHIKTYKDQAKANDLYKQIK